MDKTTENNKDNINNRPKADCPCKRTSCERHGNCAACRTHHRSMKKLVLTTCERMEAKNTGFNKKKIKPSHCLSDDNVL